MKSARSPGSLRVVVIFLRLAFWLAMLGIILPRLVERIGTGIFGE